MKEPEADAEYDAHAGTTFVDCKGSDSYCITLKPAMKGDEADADVDCKGSDSYCITLKPAMKGDEADADVDCKGSDSYWRSGSSQTRTRKRAIIIGVVVAILIAVIVVVVVVVAQKEKDDGDNSNHSKYSKECGPFELPDKLNFSDLSPTIISNSYTCPLGGDCWSGEKCFECFKLDRWKVGNINYIPVCCPDCLVRGLSVSNSKCNCMYNRR